MADDKQHSICKGVAVWIGMGLMIVTIPLTGGLIIPIVALIWLAAVMKKRRQAAYNQQVQRQKQDDDAAYGRRMRGY